MVRSLGLREDVRSRTSSLPMMHDLIRRSGRLRFSSTQKTFNEHFAVVMEVEVAFSTITPTSALDPTHNRQVHLEILRTHAHSLVQLAAEHRLNLDSIVTLPRTRGRSMDWSLVHFGCSEACKSLTLSHCKRRMELRGAMGFEVRWCSCFFCVWKGYSRAKSAACADGKVLRTEYPCCCAWDFHHDTWRVQARTHPRSQHYHRCTCLDQHFCPMSPLIADSIVHHHHRHLCGTGTFGTRCHATDLKKGNAEGKR